MTLTLHAPAPVPTLRDGARLAPVPRQAGPARWAQTPQPSSPAVKVAAVRVSERLFPRVAASLRDAGFAVLDIAAHPVGPRPSVVVVELPEDDAARRRLLATKAAGAGRIFLDPRPAEASPSVLPGGDEVVQAPFHPLQVAAAALRVSRAEQRTLADWARQAFDTTHVGR